jgi:hypothetical protein
MLAAQSNMNGTPNHDGPSSQHLQLPSTSNPPNNQDTAMTDLYPQLPMNLGNLSNADNMDIGNGDHPPPTNDNGPHDNRHNSAEGNGDGGENDNNPDSNHDSDLNDESSHSDHNELDPIDQLFNTLGDDDLIADILDMYTPEALEDEVKTNLRELAQQLAPSERDRASRTKPRHPWRCVMRINKLKLDTYVEDYLAAHGTEPSRFMMDAGMIQPHNDEEETVQAFRSIWIYAQELLARKALDGFRFCFTMLYFYDLVKSINPRSTGRIGKLMFEDLRDFLDNTLPALGGVRGATNQAEVLTTLNDWSYCGYKLSVIVDRFGEGCLFYLGSVLSHNL